MRCAHCNLFHLQYGGARSHCSINGAATSLRVLKLLGTLLVDSNGQHSSLSLRDARTQLELLDRIAGIAPLADAFGRKLGRLREVEEQLSVLRQLGDEEERDQLQETVDKVHWCALLSGAAWLIVLYACISRSLIPHDVASGHITFLQYAVSP